MWCSPAPADSGIGFWACWRLWSQQCADVCTPVGAPREQQVPGFSSFHSNITIQVSSIEHKGKRTSLPAPKGWGAGVDDKLVFTKPLRAGGTQNSTSPWLARAPASLLLVLQGAGGGGGRTAPWELRRPESAPTLPVALSSSHNSLPRLGLGSSVLKWGELNGYFIFMFPMCLLAWRWRLGCHCCFWGVDTSLETSI